MSSPEFKVVMRLPFVAWQTAQRLQLEAAANVTNADYKTPIVYNGLTAGLASNLSLVAGTQSTSTTLVLATTWIPAWWMTYLTGAAVTPAAASVWNPTSSTDAAALGWALYICLGPSPGSCTSLTPRRAVVNGTLLSAAQSAAAAQGRPGLRNDTAAWINISLHAAGLKAGRHFITLGMLRVAYPSGTAALTLSNLNTMLVTSSPSVPLVVELTPPRAPLPLVGVSVPGTSIRCVASTQLPQLYVSWSLPADSFIMTLDASLRVTVTPSGVATQLQTAQSVGRRTGVVLNVAALATTAGVSITSNHVFEFTLVGSTVSGLTTENRTTQFRVCTGAPAAPSTVLLVNKEKLPLNGAAWSSAAQVALNGTLAGSVAVGATQLVHIAWSKVANITADGVPVDGYALGLGLERGDVSLTGMLPLQLLAAPSAVTYTLGEAILSTPHSHGLTLYGTLLIRDAAGSSTLVPLTNPISVIGTPPRLPTAAVEVAPSTAAAIASLADSARVGAQSSLTQICFAWSGFSNDLVNLTAAVRSVAFVLDGAAMALARTNTGSACMNGLQLKQGSRYWITLTAQLSGYPASMAVMVTSGSGIFVDALPPTVAAVISQPRVVSVSAFEVAWLPSTAASSIESYAVGLTTCANACAYLAQYG
ncbi:MAG: hypothetical protein EOO65_03295, partial [Methanosarcinales archaeon]